MKKKTLLYMITSILLIGCQSNKRQIMAEFVDKGVIERDSDYKVWSMDRFFDDNYASDLRVSLEQGEFENGLKDPAVPNAQTAFYIAKIILINKYGEEDVRKDYPFEVYLVDNYEWKIVGSGKGRNRYKDPMSIYCSICRLDGRILGCSRNK